MAATIGSTRITIPAPPPYGVSSTDRWRPSPNSRRSRVRTVTRPRSWMRPGMLSARGPETIVGNRVRTSISRVTSRVTSSPPGTPGHPANVAAGPSDARPAGGRRFGDCRSSASASTTISPRLGAKMRMNARTAGRSNVPYGSPRTTYTSFSPTRYTSWTVPRSAPSTPRTVTPTTSCQYTSPRASSPTAWTTDSR